MFSSKYGVARHIYIAVPKAGSANHAVGADWTPSAGDVKISKDGGAAANVTNLPTAIAMGNSALWDFSLTATEMQAAQIVVTVSDSATKAVDDTGFPIETYGHASAQHEFDLDTPTVVAASVTAGVTVTTNNDKTGYGLSAAAVQAIWDAAVAALTTVGSIGKRLVDNLTGDIFARLGAPAGASTAADIAAVKVDSAAIKAKTDQLAFTTANQVDARNFDKTGYSVAAGGIGAGAHAAAELNAIADAHLDRNMATGTDSGTDSTAVRTPRQALRRLRNKEAIAAGVLTTYKEDDATASWTAAATTTAGNPLSAIDPT